MHPPSASVNTKSMERQRRRILSSIPYANAAERIRAKIFIIRRGELAHGFAATNILPLFVGLAMMPSTRTAFWPASKVGLLIHFMFFQIPILKLQTVNLVAKIRLILPNKRVPDFPLGLG